MKFLFVYTQKGIFDIAFALKGMGHSLVVMDETAVQAFEEGFLYMRRI